MHNENMDNVATINIGLFLSIKIPHVRAKLVNEKNVLFSKFVSGKYPNG